VETEAHVVNDEFVDDGEVQRSKGVCQRDLARDRRGRTVRDRECHCHFSGRTNRGRCASYHGEYEGNYYSTGSAPLGDHNTVQLVYTETPDGKFDVIGRLDGPLETLGVQIPAKTDEAGTDTPRFGWSPVDDNLGRDTRRPT
jgi:hypothetical protein